MQGPAPRSGWGGASLGVPPTSRPGSPPAAALPSASLWQEAVSAHLDCLTCCVTLARPPPAVHLSLLLCQVVTKPPSFSPLTYSAAMQRPTFVQPGPRRPSYREEDPSLGCQPKWSVELGAQRQDLPQPGGWGLPGGGGFRPRWTSEGRQARGRRWWRGDSPLCPWAYGAEQAWWGVAGGL